MKLSKAQLQKIIKEELNNVNEAIGAPMYDKTAEEVVAGLIDLAATLDMITEPEQDLKFMSTGNLRKYARSRFSDLEDRQLDILKELIEDLSDVAYSLR